MASRQPLPERFWSKVDVRSADECWEWRGALSTNGYGRFNVGGHNRQATRVVWELFKGERPPSDLFVCHSCDNRSCVNPDHLWLGTNQDNILDCRAKGRLVNVIASANAAKTHCVHGHEYTPENTKLTRRGRDCRACHREWQRQYKERTR